MSIGTAARHPAGPATPPPEPVSAWLRRAAGGDAQGLLAALQALRERAAAAAPGLWLHFCPEGEWAAQLQLLRARLAEPCSGAQRLVRYPLLGVPFAVKDNIDIAGAPTTAACPAYAYQAVRSATVVQRLLDAGALWVGKTNLDQFATGLVGTRTPYGRLSCIDDAARISGGSSSGSAIAVARGFAAFSLGTDTAGSGRVPALFNGLVGLKPTPGRISTAGVVPACRSVDCVSVFAHSVDDAARVLAVAEGADSADPYSADVRGPARLPERRRIGVPRQLDLDAAIGYPAAWAAALLRVREQGHEVVEIDFAPLFEAAALLYEGPWVAERHVTVQQLLASHPDAIDPTVRRVIARALDVTATQAFEGQYRLQALKASLAPLWRQIDLLMVPTAPTHPTFSAVDAEPVAVNSRLGTYTNFVNLLGWCALAVPAGRTAAKLPFGVTFIAPGGSDAALADALRDRAPGDADGGIPALTPATEPALPIAVVGAHLSGLPLNGQLRERGAVLLQSTTTAPHYKLYALPATTPPKPGLVRVAAGDQGGRAITLEVWSLPQRAVGSFLALIPPPLGLGSVELADGSHVHGFLCEPHALQGAEDITHHGGWRNYLASLSTAPHRTS